MKDAINLFTSWWRRRSPPVRTPSIRQLEAVECGAAALAIVLAYWGRYVSLDTLRAVCGVSRDGVKASHLVRAARSYGMLASGKILNSEELQHETFPLICYWQKCHFLVLEGVRQGRYYLNDPASGRRCVSLTEFQRHYSGVALALCPGPEFVRAGTPTRFYSAVWAHLTGLHTHLLFILLAVLLTVLIERLMAIIVKVFIDQVLVLGLQDWLLPLLLGMGAAAMFVCVQTWLCYRQVQRLEMFFSLRLARQLFWHLMHLPLDFHARRTPGQTTAVFTAAERVGQVISQEWAVASIQALSVMLLFLMPFIIDWQMTALALLVWISALFLWRVLAAKTSVAVHAVKQEQLRLNLMTMTGLEQIESLKMRGAEAAFLQRWSHCEARLQQSRQRQSVLTTGLDVVPGVCHGVLLVLLSGVGIQRVMTGEMSLGTLMFIQLLTLSLWLPFSALLQTDEKLQGAALDLAQLEDVLQAPVASPAASPIAPPIAPPISSPSSPLSVCDLSFGYSRLEAPLLSNFSLELTAGRLLAIVGEGGSGKSTIARLMMGQCTPWSGEIALGGEGSSSAAAQSDKQIVAFVSDANTTLAASVRDNVSLWDASLLACELHQALQDVGLDVSVLKRRGGYDALLSDGGRNFSTGENQRIALARVLVRQPRVVILDEALAALDPASEQQIYQALRQRGCACLILSQRLASVRHCDEILVLAAGNIVERGTHAQLVAAQGAYCRLFSRELGC